MPGKYRLRTVNGRAHASATSDSALATKLSITSRGARSAPIASWDRRRSGCRSRFIRYSKRAYSFLRPWTQQTRTNQQLKLARDSIPGKPPSCLRRRSHRPRLAECRRPRRHRARRRDRQRRVPARSRGVRQARPDPVVDRRRSAMFFQTIFNTEVMRYIVATGEPVVTGFMRTPPSLDDVGVGLRDRSISCRPAGRRGRRLRRARLLSVRRPPRRRRQTRHCLPRSASALSWSASPCCWSAGGSSARSRCSTGSWSAACSGGFLLLALLVVPGRTWGATALGFFGFDADAGKLRIPPGRRRLLPARRASPRSRAPAACANITLSTGRATRATAWAQHAGYIPAAVGGKKRESRPSRLHVRAECRVDARAGAAGGASCARISGVSSSSGSLLGMALPALFYVTFLPHGTRHPRSRHQRRAGTRRRRATRLRWSEL